MPCFFSFTSAGGALWVVKFFGLLPVLCMEGQLSKLHLPSCRFLHSMLPLPTLTCSTAKAKTNLFLFDSILFQIYLKSLFYAYSTWNFRVCSNVFVGQVQAVVSKFYMVVFLMFFNALKIHVWGKTPFIFSFSFVPILMSLTSLNSLGSFPI